jgi:hypothetical protein
MMATSLQARWQALQPQAQTRIAAGIFIASVAMLISLIWGKVALTCFAGFVFCAWYHNAPIQRLWKYAELKGVVLAVVTAITPFVPWGGVLANGYLSICILHYQHQQAKTIVVLEEIEKKQKELIEKLQKEIKVIEERVGKLQALLEKIKTGTSQLKDAQQVVFTVTDRMDQVEKMAEDLEKVHENIRSNPEQQQLKEAILFFQEQARQLQVQIEEYEKQNKSFNEQIQSIKAANQQFAMHERQRSDVTSVLSQFVS